MQPQNIRVLVFKRYVDFQQVQRKMPVDVSVRMPHMLACSCKSQYRGLFYETSLSALCAELGRICRQSNRLVCRFFFTRVCFRK